MVTLMVLQISRDWQQTPHTLVNWESSLTLCISKIFKAEKYLTMISCFILSSSNNQELRRMIIDVLKQEIGSGFNCRNYYCSVILQEIMLGRLISIIFRSLWLTYNCYCYYEIYIELIQKDFSVFLLSLLSSKVWSL